MVSALGVIRKRLKQVPHLPSQTATGDDVIVHRMKLQAPRSARMTHACLHFFAGRQVIDANCVIAVRSSQSTPIRRHGHDEDHASTGRNLKTCIVQ